MKYGFIRKFLPLTVPLTGARASPPLGSCFLCNFRTHLLERSAEKALNLGITGAFWDTLGSLRSSASCESPLFLPQPTTIKRTISNSSTRALDLFTFEGHKDGG